MARARKAVAALRRGERGLTLVELLVAASLGLLVVGGAMTMFIGAVRSEPRTAAKVGAIQQARVTIERVSRELRQGLEVPTSPAPTASHLEIVTYVKTTGCGGEAGGESIACRVIYDCEGDACTRAVAEPDGGNPGPAVTVATDLADAGVFSYAPSAADPAYVGVEFALANEGGDPIVLDDGVALRNLGEEDEGEEA